MDGLALRQLANGLGKAAGLMTARAVESGVDLKVLTERLGPMLATAEACRRMAREIEAEAAMADPNAPLCLSCRLRGDSGAGLQCGAGLDTKEAAAKRHCASYQAVVTRGTQA